jgi:hypothetical protein
MRFSRRMLLLVAVAAAPLIACGGGPMSRRRTLHVTPGGGGDGTSWDNAVALHELGDALATVAPGGEVLIAAERGEYTVTEALELADGGRADQVIHLRGVNSGTGEAMPAVIRGDRTEEEMGSEVFRLLGGAHHLRFSHLSFKDVGNGCFRVSGPVTGLVIEDCSFENIYRFLENTTSDGEKRANLRQFVVRRCEGAGVERGFLRIRYASRDGVIEECRAQGTANEGGHIPAGCALDDRASDILYRACVMEGFQQWRGGDYWNGDGFSDEENNQRIQYRDCEARGSTDGGFDCKSRGLVLENCVAEDNKRNFRIWSGDATMTGCTSRRPNFRGRDVENADACHLWIGAERGRVQVTNLTIEDSDSTAIFEFEHDEAVAEIRGLTVSSPHRNWGDASVSDEGDALVVSQS